MSISKVKSLQGKITKKFKAYTSFQFSQGFDHQKNKFYHKLTVYDEVHSHREHKTFDSAIEELEHYLSMNEKQFFYESAKDKAQYRLSQLKSKFEDLADEIAELETIIRKIELKEQKS